jgi:hypothetical protein
MLKRRRIFIPSGTEETELCHPMKGEDFERINVEINGVTRGASW